MASGTTTAIAIGVATTVLLFLPVITTNSASKERGRLASLSQQHPFGFPARDRQHVVEKH